MASLINPLDNVGVSLPGLKDVEDAMHRAGLDYGIEVIPVRNRFTGEDSKRFYEVFRSDNRAMIGQVESGYTPQSNAECFVPIISALTEKTDARIVRAGEWGDGAYSFMTIEWPEEMDVKVLGVDRIRRRAMMTLNHTGKQSNLFMFLPFRLLCSNGLVITIPGCEWMFRVMHKSSIAERMKDIQTTVNKSLEYWDHLPAVMEVLATTQVSSAKADDFAKRIFDPSGKAKKQKNDQPNEALSKIARFHELMKDQPGSGQMGNTKIETSAWWVLQAMLHMSDHERGTRVRSGQQDAVGAVSLQRFKAHWPGNQGCREKEMIFSTICDDPDLGIRDRIKSLLN